MAGVDRPARTGSGNRRSRWIVIDVETSGLDPKRDRLLSVGAVAVQVGDGRARIVLADSLELPVAQDMPSSRPNILVHGIGEQAQRSGLAPTQAAHVLAAYLRDSPLVAFHASFDRAFVSMALKAGGMRRPSNPWLDLAGLAPALHPGSRARGLDDWLAAFAIPAGQRHDACADALATAMLFVRLLSDVPPRERHLRSLLRTAGQARWLGRPA